MSPAACAASGLPARRFGLTDRGLIRPGMKADIVLFDPNQIADKATFVNPHQYAVGVQAVWVNGILAAANGKATGALAGQVLYGPAYLRPTGSATGHLGVQK